MPENREPCRLHIIFASKANKAVVIRRGPTKWYRLSLWHTDSDRFEHGQWFKGRIYEQRSDLSPDGSLFLYFAAKHGLSGKSMAVGYRSTWTAISKPPYLTALALWAIGDTWMGGGLFLNQRTVWLNKLPCFPAAPHPNHRPPKRLRIIPNTKLLSGNMPMFIQRLHRDGWVTQPEGVYEQTDWQTAWMSNEPFTWHKTSRDGRFHLIMNWVLVYYDEVFSFDLVNASTQEKTALHDWKWADWDQRGRLIGVRNGQIWTMNPDRLYEDETLLADFNDQKPEPMVAPGWARRW
jgi:hypothetical protein